MFKKIILSGIFSLLILAPIATAADSLPKPEGAVNDLANVISSEYRQKLRAIVNEVESKTSAEIAVLTVESISPYDEAGYARAIFDNWKIGKKGKDNGALVLLAVKERRWRIETGYGLEGILPDGRCGEIGRSVMVPLFKEGKYGQGMYQGVAAIARIIAKNDSVKLESLEGADGLPSAVRPAGSPDIFLYFFIPIFFFLWNLPWPVYIGLPVTILFALVFYGISPIFGILAIVSYIVSMVYRLIYWNKLPKQGRANLFGPQTYGGTWTSTSGGWGGGGFSGGGGFGGGGGGGGGAGGGF